MKKQHQTIQEAAAASVAEAEYLLAQFWSFRRILDQARQQQATFHIEDKLLTACVLEALQRDILMGLCRLEDSSSSFGLRKCKDTVQRVFGQTAMDDYMKSISQLNDELKKHDLKQSHRNRYIAHLSLPANEQPRNGPMESEIGDMLKIVTNILASISCAPNSSLQFNGCTVDVGVEANASLQAASESTPTKKA